MKASRSSELLGRELDLGLAAPDLLRRRVEAQVADLEHRRALARPRRTRARSARQQLGEGEGLGQVVVGAAVEAGDAVVERRRARSASGPATRPLRRAAAGRSRSRRCPAASRRGRSRRSRVAPAIHRASSPRCGHVDGQALLLRPPRSRPAILAWSSTIRTRMTSRMSTGPECRLKDAAGRTACAIRPRTAAVRRSGSRDADYSWLSLW